MELRQWNELPDRMRTREVRKYYNIIAQRSSSTTAASTSGYKVNVTAPAGAALYVDSVYVGIVPCSFEKKSGTKTITLTQNGYNTISYSISIANSSGDLNYAFPDMTKKE